MKDLISKHGRGAAALLVVLAAVALRAPGASWGLPMLLEEATPMREAFEMWADAVRGRLDLNPHFFNYPSLTIYIQMALQGMAYAIQRLAGAGFDLETFLLMKRIDPTQFVLIGRWTSILFGAATVGVIYLIIKRLAGWVAGLLAAALLAIAPFHIIESRLVLTDLPLGFFMTLSVFLAMRIVDRRRTRDYILFGACVGLAAASKYPGLIALVSLLPAHAHVALREQKSRVKALIDRRLLAAFLATVVIFFIASPYCALDFSSFWNDFSFERGHMQEGHFGQIGGEGSALLYYLRNVLADDFGILVTLMFLAGLIVNLLPSLLPGRAGGMRGPDGKIAAHRVICALFPLVFLALIGSWSMRAERYLVPLAPFVAGLSVLFLFRAAALIRLGERLRRWSIAILFIAAAVQPVIGGFRAAALTVDTRERARNWVLEHISGNGVIAKEFLTPDFWALSHVYLVRQRIGLLEGRARESGLTLLSRISYYRIIDIPLNIIFPEASTPYYDIRLFGPADIVITSSRVKGRYTDDPQRFPAQTAFYGDLERYWERSAIFEPDRRTMGPGIEIFSKRENTDSLVTVERGTIEVSWYHGSRINMEELNLFSKPLAKSALSKGDYDLADALFHAADEEDSEVRFGLAAVAVVKRRYGEMLEHIDWLARRHRFVDQSAGPAAGPARADDSLRELRMRMVELLDLAVQDTGLPDGTKAAIRDLRDRLLPR